MANRRSTDSSASQPALKVVGFHVEGVPPSPAQAGLLHDALTAGGGSPDPVIIPPSFQSEMTGRSTLPASPERLNTLPSFIPHHSEAQGVQDILSHGLATNVHGPAPLELRRGVSPTRTLAHTGSLPPMTGHAVADWQDFAASIIRTSPANSSPRAQREARSQPTSANATPPVSPYRTEQEQRPSTSHRQSAFELAQPHAPEPQLPATFTDGTRIPDRIARKIQPHMGATYSDGSKMPSVEPSRHEVGTPRLQHGFQVLASRSEPVSPFAPFSSQSSTPRAATAASSSAVLPSSSKNPKEPQQVPKSPQIPDLPAVPQALTNSATALRGSDGKAGPDARPSAARASNTKQQHDSKAHNDARHAKDSRAHSTAPDGTAESSRRSEQGGKDNAGDKKKPTKAERRALQERQRAEKAASKEAEGKQRGGQPVAANAQSQTTGPSRRDAGAAATSRSDGLARAGQGHASAQAPAAGARSPSKAKPAKAVAAPVRKGQTSEIFAHLPQYRAITLENVFQESPVATKVHPAILQLGLRYADGTLTGSNARCLAMLLAFKTVIQDYQTPKSKELSRDLTSQLNLCIQFLVECRPLSVSMGTAIKNLKLQVSHISADTPQEDAKLQLLEEIDTFIQEKITYADEQVSRIAQTKVIAGDVVLTFAFSSAVLNTLLAAKKEGKDFRVIVVDSRPHYEGKAMLAKLLASGIPCTYLHLSALCYTMQEATKVFVGASGAMSNGTIIARAGAASVAMAASALQRPVIVCCETLKFVDRVQLDSITYNELGDPESLANVPGRPELRDLSDWQEQSQLELLNLVYDAMPCDFVTMIITEVGAIPPSSIPVVLREYRTAPKM